MGPDQGGDGPEILVPSSESNYAESAGNISLTDEAVSVYGADNVTFTVKQRIDGSGAEYSELTENVDYLMQAEQIDGGVKYTPYFTNEINNPMDTMVEVEASNAGGQTTESYKFVRVLPTINGVFDFSVLQNQEYGSVTDGGVNPFVINSYLGSWNTEIMNASFYSEDIAITNGTTEYMLSAPEFVIHSGTSNFEVPLRISKTINGMVYNLDVTLKVKRLPLSGENKLYFSGSYKVDSEDGALLLNGSDVGCWACMDNSNEVSAILTLDTRCAPTFGLGNYADSDFVITGIPEDAIAFYAPCFTSYSSNYPYSGTNFVAQIRPKTTLSDGYKLLTTKYGDEQDISFDTIDGTHHEFTIRMDYVEYYSMAAPVPTTYVSGTAEFSTPYKKYNTRGEEVSPGKLPDDIMFKAPSTSLLCYVRNGSNMTFAKSLRLSQSPTVEVTEVNANDIRIRYSYTLRSGSTNTFSPMYQIRPTFTCNKSILFMANEYNALSRFYTPAIGPTQ